MPGGGLDIHAVQYAAKMKMFSSKNGQRPDKHCLRQQGLAKRLAPQTRLLESLKDRLRKQLCWLICQALSGTRLHAELLHLLKDLGRLANSLLGPPIGPALAMAGAGGGGGVSATTPGRGPPVDLLFQAMNKLGSQSGKLHSQQPSQNKSQDRRGNLCVDAKPEIFEHPESAKGLTALSGDTSLKSLNKNSPPEISILSVINQKTDKHINKTRRDFLEMGGKTILATGLAPIINLVTATKSKADLPPLPPGIEISKKIDEKTAHAYQFLKTGYTDAALGTLSLIDVNFRGNPISIANQVNPNTHKIDPGYHVVASLTWSEILNMNGTYTTYFNERTSSHKEGLFQLSHHQKIINTIEDKNMLNCANGIVKYMIKWYVKDFRNLEYLKPKPEDIEKTFLSAIFGSAGINNKTKIDIIKTKLSSLGYKGDFNFNTDNSNELSQSYMNLPDNRFKKIVLDETLNSLSQLKKDSKELLISAWSSFWLTNHYWMLSEKKEDKFSKSVELINNIIEIPLRKYISRIRGPPYYLNSDI